MSWHFLPELVVGSSVLTFSDGERWRPSKLNRTAVKWCCGDKGTLCSPCFQFGTTLDRFEESLGADVLTWLRQVSHASRSASQENVWPKTTRATAGHPPSESFGRWDPATRCWRTSQASLLTPTLEPFSETWPRAGSMRSGTVSRRLPSAPLTDATGSGSWPTPRREDGQSCGAHRGFPDTLTSAVRVWPTPKSSPSGPDFARMNREGSGGDDLATAVARETWPTPSKSDYRTGYPDSEAGRRREERGKTEPLRDVAAPGGQLNPDWVEWLMGWPIGWTDLKPLATDKFRSWWCAHGGR